MRRTSRRRRSRSRSRSRSRNYGAGGANVDAADLTYEQYLEAFEKVGLPVISCA